MSDAWRLLLGGFVYVCAHCALYLVVIRHLSVFRQERRIFFYHLGSFTALMITVFAFSLVSASAETIKASLGALAVHAIYSISFLEAWSLSQISYSIAILDTIETRPGLDLAMATQRFADTGRAKKVTRLAALQRLRLIAIRNGQAALSPRGRIVAGPLSALRWIANLQMTG